MTGTTRSSEGLDARRRKLLFRSWHRGMREMDLILGAFADAEIGALTDAEIDQYERLLDSSRHRTPALAHRRAAASRTAIDTRILAKILAFRAADDVLKRDP